MSKKFKKLTPRKDNFMIAFMEKERLITAKFGGSAMADPGGIWRAVDILRRDWDRRFVVVSAPGVPFGRTKADFPKVTDLSIEGRFGEVEARFGQLAYHFRCTNPLLPIRDELSERWQRGTSLDREWIASRGEWAMAKILAEITGGIFVDAAELLLVNKDGSVNPDSYQIINERLSQENRLCIIPGFYGCDRFRNIRTLPRNGSDISGAVIARGVNARLYENWTDTNGIYTSDPKKDPRARQIPRLSFQEYQDWCCQALHPGSLWPLFGTDILLQVRNLFDINNSGTILFDEQFNQRIETIREFTFT